MNDYFLIPCKIERGGFSTERIFTIKINDEERTFAGYYEHFLDKNREPLPLTEPSQGSIEGFAKCRVIQRFADSLIIDIPSSDSLEVSSDTIEAA